MGEQLTGNDEKAVCTYTALVKICSFPRRNFTFTTKQNVGRMSALYPGF
jgi:hypothetical protein